MRNIIIIFVVLMFSAIGYAQLDPKINSGNQPFRKDDEKTVMASASELINKGVYYYSKDAISQEVMTKLHELGIKDPISANPGEKFQAGDVIREEGLPWRQLIVLIKDDKGNCVIAYNHGGYFFHEHVLFFEVKGGEITAF